MHQRPPPPRPEIKGETSGIFIGLQILAQITRHFLSHIPHTSFGKKPRHCCSALSFTHDIHPTNFQPDQRGDRALEARD
jgi:hypothetical protein